MTMIFRNAKVVLPNKVINGSVRVFDGLIKEIGEFQAINEETIDCKNNYLLPGFVDCHTHGSGGYDFMDGDTEAIEKAAESLIKGGTTSFLATSLTSSDDELVAFLKKAERAQSSKKGARLLGVHLEGPFINKKEKGAQDERYIVKPTIKHIEKFLSIAPSLVKRVSLAPEMDEDCTVIDYLVKENINVSCAHSNATLDEVKKAYDHGLKELTHFYSGMSTITRHGGFRVLGCVESGYLLDDMYVELIGDGMHLPPALLDYIFRFKRHDRIVVCSDSMRGAGMKDGPSILGPRKNGTSVIIEDGIAKMPDRSCFAGSVATGERLFNTLYKIMSLDVVEISRLLSLQPACTIGMDREIGSIEVGKKADLLIINEEGKIEKIYKEGVEIKR